MPTWYYFARPQKMAFHDLTPPNVDTPANLRSLLGLGHKFIPAPTKTENWSAMRPITQKRLERSVFLKSFFAGKPPDRDTFDPKMYVKSNWEPPKYLLPRELPRRFDRFDIHMSSLFKRKKARSNLLPHQLRSLTYLQKQNTFIIVQADKNLGPCVMTREQYIQFAWRDHLSDRKTYRRIDKTNLNEEERRIRNVVDNWLRNYAKSDLTTEERKFIRAKQRDYTNFFPTFYLTMKVHKTPLKSRPVVSCSGSYLEGLGKWVDSKLKIVAQAQKSYFKSSAELMKELKNKKLPRNARLFTADAKAMYTNIPTERALRLIGEYLRKNQAKFPTVPVKALIEALSIIMRNNIFQFGDTFWKQLIGAAMGTPPAPPYATVYYAILENIFLTTFAKNLELYRRFLDDVLGIWVPHDENNIETEWTSFQETMNDKTFGLTWEFTPLARKCDFMDLSLSINDDGTIRSTMYEKPTNLHLYIPPQSAHPPGLIAGVINGTMHRIRTLCTDEHDQRKQIQLLYNRLRARGYKATQLTPIFCRAINATNDRPKALKAKESKIFLHVRYHPDGPPAHKLQKAWCNCVAAPQYGKPLAAIRNQDGKPIGEHRLVIAYSRNPNLGNLLSSRRMDKHGPPVSSYWD